jgi:hypothetical protein
MADSSLFDSPAEHRTVIRFTIAAVVTYFVILTLAIIAIL